MLKLVGYGSTPDAAAVGYGSCGYGVGPTGVLVLDESTLLKFPDLIMSAIFSALMRRLWAVARLGMNADRKSSTIVSLPMKLSISVL